ncbi:hypothetical protein BE20_13485 [Sorangium cellulosum]|uniref:DUF4190 domain-containing protein n=1 Tax=Sorangium cellulosum TaxID=56 RepID=A0A150SM48_SORCE|nr:hypothetical protein BE20_13485 [Sorangium cellulosum]KYF93521.1 hypothetical protein BE18_30535 [Sorangium cellulosum]
MEGKEPPSTPPVRPTGPPGANPVPSLEGLFPRPHPSSETLFRLGAAAMVLGPLAGVPAILLGRIVHREITRSEGRYTGEARARLGFGLGWAGTQVYTLLLLYAIGATFEPVALVVLGAGVLAGLVIAIGASATGAPQPFATAAQASRQAPWVICPAIAGLLGVGFAGFITKQNADERARLETLAACQEARRSANEALAAASFERARSKLQDARRTCVEEAALQEIARIEADVDAKEREAIQRRAEEEAAREERERAEKELERAAEQRRRAEREQKAAARFKDVAPTIARHVQVASSRATQRRWEDAQAALSQAELALDEFRGTGVQQSERCAALLAQVVRLRPDVDAGVEQARQRREEEERRRQQMKEAAEERLQEMKEAAEERRQASLRVQCCDGTISPSCLCGRSSYRGCCSHHGGVCGCEE